jgi:hypothetical protein
VHVVHGEGGERDPVGHEGGLERADGGVLARLEHQLDAVGVLRRYDGEPAVLTHGDVGLLHEAQHVGVEAQGLLLVVDEHARQVDPHGRLLRDRSATGR